MIPLAENTIHLWYTQPQALTDPQLLERYWALLTQEEQEKQQRYRFAKNRHDALITRAFIRDTLSHYMAIAPEDWRFIKGEKDKPEIANPHCDLRFNLSHTEDFIVCAITRHNAIGVDIEHTPRDNDILAIADRYFSPLEVDALFSLPEEAQRSRFFDYWTLKESYIKACGLGLAIPLDHFSFHIGERNNATTNANIRLSFSPERCDYPENWQSWLFYPKSDYRIALSVQSSATQTLQWFSTTPLIQHQPCQLPL